ncbi:C2H2-type zinc finger protein [Sporobolomyces koalae]|uniref:C2H2-type zinc finger protein n=1 Tax=Sporobolomyces koalae TaxID=500713 RepID=UPI00316D2D23
MGKKKSKSQKLAALAWCWYCDRTFEDQRVLLSHQKAKHFRCSMCPRRLNTAGGLAVHLDQVHKVGTDKIENALPGRESFDVEIYGMEGVPAADLAAWKKRQAEEAGIPTDEQRPKKARFAQVALTPAEAKAQLAAHRILMGLVPAPVDAAVAIPLAAPPAPVPVPGMPPVPAPPPGFMPPPGFAPPPGMPFPPPPGAMPFPMVPGMPPPPGFPMPPAGLAFPPPGMLPPPGFVPPPGMPLAPPAAPVPAAAPQSVRQKVPSSSVTLKPGTLLVYGDNDVSPEEKRARLSQYSVANEPRLAAAPSTAGPASATGPADASAVGSYASVATEGAPASVVTGEAKGIDHNGGGDPQTAEIETGGAAAAAVAAGGKKRARAADLMG